MPEDGRGTQTCLYTIARPPGPRQYSLGYITTPFTVPLFYWSNATELEKLFPKLRVPMQYKIWFMHLFYYCNVLF